MKVNINDDKNKKRKMVMAFMVIVFLGFVIGILEGYLSFKNVIDNTLDDCQEKYTFCKTLYEDECMMGKNPIIVTGGDTFGGETENNS